MDLYLLSLLKGFIAFLFLLAATRLMGRKFIHEMTSFDFAVTMTMGGVLANFTTADIKAPYIILGASALVASVVLISFLTLNSLPARKLIEGEPLVIIQNGKILEKNMKITRYNLDNLEMQLRKKSVFNIGDVEFAILEPNGELSVLKKSQYEPLTPKDLHISTKYKGLASEIIKDGEVLEQNLNQNNLSFAWLYNQLHSRGINNVDDVFYAALNTDGTLYIDLKGTTPKYTQKIED